MTAKVKVFTLLVGMLMACDPYNDYLGENYGKVSWTDSHGVRVATNGYDVDRPAFDDYVTSISKKWQWALDDAGIKCQVDVGYLQWYVAFESFPFVSDKAPGITLAGLMIPDYATMVILVGFRADGIDKGAFGHEMGHAILMQCGLSYNEEALKSWGDKYGLPY